MTGHHVWFIPSILRAVYGNGACPVICIFYAFCVTAVLAAIAYLLTPLELKLSDGSIYYLNVSKCSEALDIRRFGCCFASRLSLSFPPYRLLVLQRLLTFICECSHTT